MESESIEPISNCTSYCSTNIKVHYNEYSNLISNRNHKYRELFNDPVIYKIRSLNRQLFKNKDNTILVNQRNCDWRTEIVKKLEMTRVLKLQTFGQCHLKQNFNRDDYLLRSYLVHISMFKYVFALENSMCKNYVSEKIHRSLLIGVIPIIWSYTMMPSYLQDCRDHIFSLMEPRVVSGVIPEDKLERIYGSWKTDLEKICDLYSSNQLNTQVLNEYKPSVDPNRCIEDCKRAFGCHHDPGVIDYEGVVMALIDNRIHDVNFRQDI